MIGLEATGKIARACRGIKYREDVGCTDPEEGINQTRLTLFQHPLAPLVAEARNHWLVVR